MYISCTEVPLKHKMTQVKNVRRANGVPEAFGPRRNTGATTREYNFLCAPKAELTVTA